LAAVLGEGKKKKKREEGEKRGSCIGAGMKKKDALPPQ